MNVEYRFRTLRFHAMLAAALAMAACHGPQRTTLTLSAAASLQDAVVEAEATYTKSHPDVEIRNNFGSSGTLAHEIEQGAPVDAFISAAAKPMDELEAKGLVTPGTRRTLLRNSLVLIAPAGSSLQGFDGLTDEHVKLVALGDPGSVPAGQYGKQTLTALHLFDRLQAKLVLGKDVRQVLTYVETGNADAGLVYATDAKISTKVRVVATAPEATHDPIVYPEAVVASSRNAQAARELVEFFGGPDAQAVFAKHGFTIATP